MTLDRLARLCLVLVLLASATSCSSEPRNCPSVIEQGTPIDATLMAFLSRARVAHHLADLKEDAEPAQAINALLSLVSGPIPQTLGTTPTEAREVLADTQARLADLLSREKQYRGALDRIATALELVPEPSYFRGHLFETRGLVEQRQAHDLMARGETGPSEAAKVRAIRAFETAMQIQAGVIRSAPPLGASAPSGANDAGYRSPEDASGPLTSGESD